MSDDNKQQTDIEDLFQAVKDLAERCFALERRVLLIEKRESSTATLLADLYPAALRGHNADRSRIRETGIENHSPTLIELVQQVLGKEAAEKVKRETEGI